VFGFGSFRANQEDVCRAAIAGRDLLLVMPTGAGKSLCYQLPAIARGGTGLVISPLIALMEDQAAKLGALGLKVARIHSGLERAVARQACVDYLNGSLQFLFIAPERLRVPGFPEMLAKRKLALIAIDEAHCISQWGHDFRPDYRMLGEWLPGLRGEGAEMHPSGAEAHGDFGGLDVGAKAPTYRPTAFDSGRTPVLAMTATATPEVQRDIIAQLGMVKPKRFIHGFRRENLAIEVVELAVPERGRAICGLLAEPARRPAIVYAPSRKQAERLAEEISRTVSAGAGKIPSGAKAQDNVGESMYGLKPVPFTPVPFTPVPFTPVPFTPVPFHPGGSGKGRRISAAAYHAGLDAETREQVQTAFQAGELEVVVATIAFGMGIDKADIRTVIHAGLPGTLEGYYQEIGRAGRDGALSRTYLMHSYADQRTHDFFLSRDYPPEEHLQWVFRVLGEEPRPVEELRAAARQDSGIGEEEFDRALEKLEIHGGARMDFAGNVRVGGPGWKKTYGIQAAHRAEQFEKVLRFTAQADCRMGALVRHFGDEGEACRPCGICDVCDPEGAVLRQFRRATATERELAERIVEELRGVEYKAAGTLQRSLDPVGRMSRGEWDGLLAAMKLAGLIEMEEAEYEKDGEVRRFRKVRLTEAGLSPRAAMEAELLLSDGIVQEFGGRGEPAPARVKKAKVAARFGAAAVAPARAAGVNEALAARIREWRAAEAKRLGVPAYVVLHDRSVNALAEARPGNPKELLAIDGIGPAKAERFGDAILRICAGGPG
jgi:superfamily II DNA helicase RecQ